MLKVIRGSTQKIYQDYVPCSFSYKFVCIDDEFTKPIVFRGEMFLMNLLKRFIKSMSTAKT